MNMVDLQQTCELDRKPLSRELIAWYLERIQKWNPLPDREVSDERLEELLAYFGGKENDE